MDSSSVLIDYTQVLGFFSDMNIFRGNEIKDELQNATKIDVNVIMSRLT